MKNNEENLIKKFISGKYLFNELNISSNKYEFYINSIDELQKISLVKINYKNILNDISNTIYIDEFLCLMETIDRSKLYKSFKHGINHNIRVSIFALIISAYEKISLKDFRLVIEAAKYHDIGRINDNEDKEHGLRSSEKIDFLRNTYDENDMNHLKTIIQCHSLNDVIFEEIAQKNNIDDIKRCRKMFNILKDADALDRVRLEWPVVKIEYIRIEVAKRLIPFAYELFENYESNLV